MKQSMNTAYLGPNSYPAVVGSIHKALEEVTCDTMTGTDLVSKALVVMNESETPILDLKDFTTNAEKVAPNDTSLMAVIDFARKQVKNGDLNCLINLAKEEHLQEQSRNGLPTPESIKKNWEEIMNQPASAIEEGIKAGLFKDLDSKLYMELENIISEDGKKNKSKNKVTDPDDHAIGNIMNESLVLTDNLAVYMPVGVRMEDPANNRMLMLTESAVLAYDRAGNYFTSLNESEISALKIPETHARLMSAVNDLAYNPKDDTFSLNENWDFALSLNEGGVTLEKNGNRVQMEKADVPAFLMESIQLYAQQNKNFNTTKFSRDADNFNMLANNYERLTKLDGLRVIRSLNESEKFVIVDTRERIQPTFITSYAGPKLFENYQDLAKDASTLLNESVDFLFAERIDFEKDFADKKHGYVVALTESQKVLNNMAKRVKNLKNVAAEDSIAMDNLNEQENLINNGIKKNLNVLDKLINQSSPYMMQLNEAIQDMNPDNLAEYVGSTAWQPINNVLTREKVAQLVSQLGSADEMRALISDDLSHFLLVYQDHFTANWVIDLYSMIGEYDPKFQQNNFGERMEIMNYLETISESAKSLIEMPESLIKN